MSEYKSSTGDYNLFDNPTINQAKKSLSVAEKERYEDWGHAVFDDIDYEHIAQTKYPPPMLNALVYIEDSINSGQHPSTLTNDEKNVLVEIRGFKWYEKWGYCEEDLLEIINIKTN